MDRMLRGMLVLGVIAAVAGLTPGAALGQAGYGDYAQPSPGAGGSIDLRAELRTAATHATNAVNSDAMSAVRSHLLHVVNCLEGPRGRNYVQAELNPCQGQGNGILVDLRTAQGGAAWAPVAEGANDLAMKGSKMTDLAAAKAMARGAAALLGAAAESLR